MARKTKTLVIESGRDQGKSFLITEMPVTRADKWANTALLAMLRGGVDVGGVNFGLIADTMGVGDAVNVAGAARKRFPAKFFYADGGSIQGINMTSTAVL